MDPSAPMTTTLASCRVATMARAPCRLPACSGPTTQRHRGAVLIPFKEATLERGRTAERRVQLTDQFSDPPTATRGGRVAPQDIHHDRMRKGPRLRKVVGSDGGIVSSGELERSRGMCGRSEDVLDLSRLARGWRNAAPTAWPAARAASLAAACPASRAS